MKRKLHIDIETFSSEPIKFSGAYRYVQSPDFEILMVAYAFDDEPIKIIDLSQGGELPEEFLEGMEDPGVEKHAHNATFERRAFIQYGIDVPIEQWYCSAIKAGYCGLPLSLELVSKALGLGDKGKLATGKALIRYFCIPCKPTKANGQRLRNFPRHNLEKWEEFKLYCINDVEAERQIGYELSEYHIPRFERDNYILDQKINDRGILIDLNIAKNAIMFDEEFTGAIKARVKEITQLDNPNSPAQLKKWLSEAIGEPVTTLAKDSLPELLEKTDSGIVREVIECRKKLAKSSTKKYGAMMKCVGYDNRARGLFQFYGANRTGRWAGRLIQLQNLPQNHIKELEYARSLVAKGDYDLALMIYENISNILSELIRTAFIAGEGLTFVVSDFSAIEARVLSWMANEKWRLDVFNTHGKIYEASAAMMFGVPIESVTKGSDLRQKGKTAELALGYQGSVGAMAQMDRDGKLTETEMRMIVKKFRKANPAIVKFWWDVNGNAINAVKYKRKFKMYLLEFDCDGKSLTIKLPSGRKLYYREPCLTINKFGKESIKFKGMDQIIKQWKWIDTYGGKLVENIVQAVSRDLLAYSMLRLDEEGFETVMHVHDEAICESPVEKGENNLKKMCMIMGENVPWAKGLPLVADGYVTPFYKKD